MRKLPFPENASSLSEISREIKLRWGLLVYSQRNEQEHAERVDVGRPGIVGLSDLLGDP